jgi:hypothetical protein
VHDFTNNLVVSKNDEVVQSNSSDGEKACMYNIIARMSAQKVDAEFTEKKVLFSEIDNIAHIPHPPPKIEG